MRRGVNVHGRIAGLMNEYMREIGSSVRLLVQLVEKLVSGDYEGLGKLYKLMEEAAERIDQAKRNVMDYIAEVSPLMLEKDNWVRLVLNIESVSDYAEGAATNIIILSKKLDEKLPGAVSEGLSQISSKALETYEALKDVILTLSTRPVLVLQSYRRVEELEREVDNIQKDLNVRIAESNMPLPVILLLRDIVAQIEDMTDLMKRAMDEARIVAIQVS